MTYRYKIPSHTQTKHRWALMWYWHSLLFTLSSNLFSELIYLNAHWRPKQNKKSLLSHFFLKVFEFSWPNESSYCSEFLVTDYKPCAKNKIVGQFLDTSLHLYKRVCPSVCPSVRWSVRWSRFRKKQAKSIFTSK